MSGIFCVMAGEGVNPYRQFLGGSISGTAATPGPATASLTLNTDGTLSILGTPLPVGQSWFNPTVAGIGTTHWVRATVNSGALSSGTSGSWLQLNSARTWTRTRSGAIGITSVNVTIEVATDAAGVNVVKSGVWQMDAETF